MKDDPRLTIHAEEGVVNGLIQQARAVNLCECTLLDRADVHEFERRAALDQRLELGRRQLTNRREAVCGGAISQGVLILRQDYFPMISIDSRLGPSIMMARLSPNLYGCRRNVTFSALSFAIHGSSLGTLIAM